VQVHLSHVFGKLAVGSRTEAVLCALRQGLIALEDTL
jgi:DNA-binding NarL/FixJ family response regulator